MEQMFKLRGDSMDLDDFARLFRKGPATIKKIEGDYYLHLTEWEPLPDDNEALDAARVALARMNGIALWEFGNIHPPKIAGITTVDSATGKLITAVHFGGCAQLRSRNAGTLNVTLEGKTVIEQPPTRGEALLMLAETRETVERLLYLYGTLEHDWRGLYMVLEVIEDDLGGQKKLLAKRFPGGEKLKLFKRTANAYKALGAAARHATTSFAAPKEKMMLKEARALIRSLIDAWIKEFL
jgi:hypothetical protein